ncbi:aldose 1-epimerase [Winogradskyella sp. R77965]|uniref:aldose 1-epimerase n=1 Tax=Winogradskyella sp. R77965 TaxID=3093872 RepID=UPI0037DC562B
MYKIEHQKDHQSNQVKLMNSSKTSYAVISLNQGASLQKLTIKDTAIIEDLLPLKYAETYASSVLFPFANRIKDGIYTFNEKQYQLETNHKEENNALHGFVYDKTFKILSENVSDSEASIKLEYEEFKISKGFPYTYTVQLIYTLNEDVLNLNVFVKNTDSKPFPFTIGWHPYFMSKNLYNSKVKFDCSKKVILGDRLITTGTEDYPHNESIQIEDKQLDDCFILDSNKIHFLTPEYDLEMTSSSKDTFLQLYTPPKKNTIAIEPTTGISDSFNNTIGLQILEPGNTYTIDWTIKLNLKS